MTKNELVDILNKMYSEAPKNDSTTMIRLFGIKYTDEITKNGIPVTEIVNESIIKNSYHAEISKGIRLAKYVELKKGI